MGGSKKTSHEEETPLQEFHVKPIGQIVMEAGRSLIKLEPDYVPALKALDGFSHINVIWWFDEFDNAQNAVSFW